MEGLTGGATNTAKCRTCLADFARLPEETWKRQCWNCYRDFRGKPRIGIGGKPRGIYVEAHPEVTKEEIDEWIAARYPRELNWGAVELTGKNIKLWWNTQCDD